MALNFFEQQKILSTIIDKVRVGRQSVKSVGCKITCTEDEMGVVYVAEWAAVDNHVLLKYTHVASDSQGLPSAFYFDGEKNYFVELDTNGESRRSAAHVLTGSAPFGEPSPLRSSYYFFGSWIDELLKNHKARISAVRETPEHGLVYDIRIEIPRRVLIIEVAKAYNFAITKTSELRVDGSVINIASDFEQCGEAWLPTRAEFKSNWRHNDIDSSWHRSYVFSFIEVNNLPLSSAVWEFTEGSTITDGIANTKVTLINGQWTTASVPKIDHDEFRRPQVKVATKDPALVSS